MTVPAAVLAGVRARVEERTGKPPRLLHASPVGGGCISPSARLEMEGGESFFLKWHPAAPTGLFAAEADGLRALRHGARGTALRVPEVVGVEDPGSPPWLLLEYIPQGRAPGEYGTRLGSGLAELHRRGASSAPPPATPGYGWPRDNFIGSLPQKNTPREEWAAFWGEMRLEPQLRVARDAGFFRGREGKPLDVLLDRLEPLLEEAQEEGPSLLHGDLWGGNAYPGPGGEPVLIDPAVYRGHREVDLAMTELFGGFGEGFYRAYREAWPLSPGYLAYRRDLYQLYYLLVHVNLFGGGYVAGTLAAASRALRGA